MLVVGSCACVGVGRPDGFGAGARPGWQRCGPLVRAASRTLGPRGFSYFWKAPLVDARLPGAIYWRCNSLSPLEGASVTELAATEDGHIYASLYEVNDTTQTKTHGLFELRAERGKASASWVPVAGTLNAHREGEFVPNDAFYRLWAKGNDLIIGRQNAAQFSWVKVIR